MRVTKVSAVSGVAHTRDIPVTPEQLEAWQRGAYIQDVMRDLSADDREFLMTGITPEEWDRLFAEDRASDAGDDEADEVPDTPQLDAYNHADPANY